MHMGKRLSQMAALVAMAVCLSAPGLHARQNPGAVFLMVWPTARSTALAGAMTALADDADAAYWNAGGLGFQQSLGGCATFAQWLPGLYPGMYYYYGSAGLGLPVSKMNLNAGVDWMYFSTGKTDVINERGEFLGRYTTYDLFAGIHGGVRVHPTLGVGLNAKYIRSFLVPEWVWKVMPELGIERGGTGNTVAADFGVLYRPLHFLSFGITLANIGPNISYYEHGESDPLPRTLRIGASFTLCDRFVRMRPVLELDKVLVGMFYDSTGKKPLRRKLGEELRDMWKSVAIEVTALQILTFRLGYFEDLTGQRGGLVFENDAGQTYHYGLGDVLTGPGLGRLRRIGLCVGCALSYKDYLRVDFSSDAAIYDFSTTNVKVALAFNNIGGLVQEFSEGRSFDWLH